MYDDADTAVLYEELAFQDVLPVTWHVLAHATERETAASFDDRNSRLLQTWDAMEEPPPVEKSDDSAHSAEILRLDMKVNLLLDLVGQLLITNHPRPAPSPIRFNALGALWRTSGKLPEAGEQGMLEIFLRDCLAEPLRLAGRVTNVTPDAQVRIKFSPLSESVSDLIEKLAFRRHRRQIAGTRQPRRGP